MWKVGSAGWLLCFEALSCCEAASSVIPVVGRAGLMPELSVMSRDLSWPRPGSVSGCGAAPVWPQ